ncbi:MAG TPA: hypothetical protein VF652_05620 [Allosphingosinicella sp.]|jgi:hypothetical protein
MADGFDLRISFPDLSPGEAGADAALLEEIINDALRSQDQPATARQQRTDPNAADLGTIVGIVLGAPATIILARGIARALVAYFSRTNRSEVAVTKPDGTVITITHLESRDVEKVAEKLQRP